MFSLFRDSIALPNAPNQIISYNDLKQIVTGEPSKRQSDALRLCREKAFLYCQTGDKKYKDLMNKEKDKLNYVTLSGVINGKRCIENLSYNGFVQIDIDCRYENGNFASLEIKRFLIEKTQDKTLPYLVMCAISPSAHGVKCMIATNNKVKKNHNATLESVKDVIRGLLNGLNLGYIADDAPQEEPQKKKNKKKKQSFEIDSIDCSKACYIPYDRDAYFNDEYTFFQYTHIDYKKALAIKEKKYVSDSKSVLYKNATIELTVNTKMDMLESIVKTYDKFGTSRNCLVFAIANKAKEHYITCNECISFCLNYCESDFAENEVRRTVNRAYATIPKIQYYDYQLVKHAKQHNSYIPKEVLEAKPRFIAPQKTVESISIKSYTGEKDEYFSKILEKYNIELSPTNLCFLQWIVPTGVGKTNTIARFANLGNPTIIICPTKGLVNMCGRKYNATVWHGDEHDIHAVLKSNFIATTYASFTKLCFEMQQKQHLLADTLRVRLFSLRRDLEAKKEKCDLLNIELANELGAIANEIKQKQLELNDLQSKDILKRYHIFFDEFHNFVANASKGFQLDDLEDILGRVKDCASFTGVTGTYLRNDAINIPIANVIVPQNRIKMNIIHCEVVRDTLTQLVMQSIEKKRLPIVFLNNTSDELERLKVSLSSVKIAYFNAHNKQDIDYQQLIDTSILSNELQGIVTTSVMKEGIDIENDLDFDFYFVGRIHSTVIKQVIARARSKKSNVEAYLLRSLKAENNSEKRFDCDFERQDLTKRSNCICEMLNMTRSENNDIQISTFESDVLRRFENLPIYFNGKTQRYEIRPLLFENHLYEIETTYETQNLNLLKENLAKLSVDLIDNSIENNAIQGDTKLQDDAILLKKAKELNQFETVLNTICSNPLEARNLILKKYKENDISKIEKKTYKILKMCMDNGYKLAVIGSEGEAPIIDCVKDIRELVELPTEKNFRTFTGILKAYILRTNKLYMNNNSILAIQIKAFLDRFDGNTLSKDEIKAKVIDIMKLNKGISINAYNDASEKDNMRKFFDVLGLFFKMDRTQKKRGENVYKFSLISLSIPKKVSNEIQKGYNQIEKESSELVESDKDWFDYLLSVPNGDLGKPQKYETIDTRQGSISTLTKSEFFKQKTRPI